MVGRLTENSSGIGVFPEGNRVMISDAAGALDESAITSSELNQLDGATSNLQTQITNLETAHDADIDELKSRMFMMG